MNKKILTLLISSLIATNAVYSEYAFVDQSDFTGDAFFTPPALTRQNAQKNSSEKKSMPPLKRARILIKNKMYEKNAVKMEQAPVAPSEDIYSNEVSYSEYASKEIEDNFDENMMPDGFEADEEAIKENANKKHFWNKDKKNNIAKKGSEDTEDIILDCENVNYDTENYCITAAGNVKVNFIKQDTTLKADLITYDRANNTIKAEGNVNILKNGQTITGEYIFVDLNEENALIEKPLTKTTNIEIKAQKGYVFGDRIVQENGSIDVQKDYMVKVKPSGRSPNLKQMIVPKNQTLSSDMEKGIIGVKAKEIKITHKGDLEILAIRHATVKKGKRTIFKIPAVKFYTNKNHDYVESNIWEVGSYRGLGFYTGPGFVFELPKGSVFKAIPMLNYKSGIGIGGVGRFSSGTNKTMMGYGTREKKFLLNGRQELDDNLYLQYGINDYIDEWFLGRRRPKYGADLVYDKAYTSDDFLLKGHASRYAHRFDIGYFHDMNHDKYFEKLTTSDIGTMRFKYMAEASQNFLQYKNEEKQTAFAFDVAAQLSAAVYGTGDTQTIGRLGPRIHTQYKRWMQDIGYFQSVYSDHTPIPVYDAFRYGKSEVYLREYFRINKYLTICWLSHFNLSNDSPTRKTFQENSFYISVGPDDVKFHIGYDFVRENLYASVEMLMNAKGTKIDYEKLEIKQNKNAKSSKDPVDMTQENQFKNSQKAPVLMRAVVEDVETVEDVL